jgi:hypothetical protein
MKSLREPMDGRRGFTLIELLVVIAIRTNLQAVAQFEKLMSRPFIGFRFLGAFQIGDKSA